VNGAQPKRPKARGKLKWNPIKRISLFAFDGWNGRVGLALLWGVKGCCCSRAPQRERPAQPNNPSTNQTYSYSIHLLNNFGMKSMNLYLWNGNEAKQRKDGVEAQMATSCK
jgi:hypothetical protein